MIWAENMKTNNSHLLNIILMAGLILIYGCGTTGKDFNESLYKNIVSGTTTHKEIQAMFGPPFKKGIQNGYKVWTYEYNAYNALGNDTTKDMVIVFTPDGIVKSHQMMTNQRQQ